MNKLLVAATVAAFGSTGALAADLPARTYTKAPVAVAAPAYNWTGFYVGVHGGGVWTRGDSGFDPLPSPALWNRSPEAFTLNGSGGLAGGHAGYNWQFAPSAVIGIEGDWSWAGANASSTVATRTAAGVPFAPVSPAINDPRP